MRDGKPNAEAENDLPKILIVSAPGFDLEEQMAPLRRQCHFVVCLLFYLCCVIRLNNGRSYQWKIGRVVYPNLNKQHGNMLALLVMLSPRLQFTYVY